MSAIRILHVDDEPDIREVVDIALGLNPDFEVRACSSGVEAIEAAVEWLPFLILLDAVMPGMDGPATLAELRKNRQSADIPVLFMTARAQTREVEHFIALGAQGVISKPFDPMTLAVVVRDHLHAVPIGTLRGIFMRRAEIDAALLRSYRSQLMKEPNPAALGWIRNIAHSLADTAAMLGFAEIGRAALAVEKAATAAPDRVNVVTDLTHGLEQFLLRLGNEWKAPSAAVA